MHKHIRLHSMGTKIFLLFFISILIFVVVLGLVSYNISKTIVMNKSSNGMDQTSTSDAEAGFVVQFI
jgi:CHASE3 domain sensor protein